MRQCKWSLTFLPTVELVTFFWYFQPRYVLRVSPPSEIHISFEPLLAHTRWFFPFFFFLPCKALHGYVCALN